MSTTPRTVTMMKREALIGEYKSLCLEMEAELAELREKFENYKEHESARSIHTHHANCDHPACVFRRERDELRGLAERLALAIENYADEPCNNGLMTIGAKLAAYRAKFKKETPQIDPEALAHHLTT